MNTPELQKELADLARFPEMNPGPVARLRLDGTVILANRVARELCGNRDIRGLNWRELCPGMNADLWERILGSIGTYPIETRFERSEGVEAIFQFTYLLPESKDLVFVYGADITRLKQVERELAEKKAIVEEIARFPDMNPGPVLRMDLTGRILLSNAAATREFGEELHNRNWKDVLPVLTERLWGEIITSSEIVPVEVRLGRDKEFVFNHRRDFLSDLVFVYGTDVTLQKLAERSLRQSEKMATLGTLAAGVAHELNNPAAATRRAALQLNEAFVALEAAHVSLNQLAVSSEESRIMQRLAAEMEKAALNRIDVDAMARSDMEVDLEEWLDEIEMEGSWKIAPALVGSGFTRQRMEALASEISAGALPAIVTWMSALYPVYALLYEIAEGSSRISEIVVALKSYSYLGQAPQQEVDLRTGIDNTLVILRNKLKEGITVVKVYDDTLPNVMAYGSELNQVWTNLIDNAADAMGGKGEITIRTRREQDHAVVEIEDNGPGIPPDIQPRVFDPFFTTKEPGKGTGLGLSTSYGIISEKHRGTIAVSSRPGLTRFTVKLPL